MKLTLKLTIIFAVLAILPVGIVGYMSYNTGRHSIEQVTINHLISTNLLKSSEMDRWVDDNTRSLEVLAQRPLVVEYTGVLTSHNTSDQAYLEAKTKLIKDHFRPRLITQSGFTEIFVMDPLDGMILASTSESEEGKYRDYQPYFTEGKNGSYVQGVYYSISREEAAMTISTPVIDDTGNLIVVLAGRLDLDVLSVIISRLTGMSKTEDTYLVNTSNYFVTEPRFGENYALKKLVRTEGVQAGLSGKNGTGYYDNYRGIKVIGAYQWLPKYNLAIITEEDVSKAFAIVTTLGWTTTGIGIGAALLVVLAGWLVARTITRPVKQLVDATEKIGKGNLEQEISTTGQDEIGDLSRSFDRMTRNLRETLVSRDELSKEVAERKQAEKELKRTMVELERSNTELERFAYIASHDLQEPLRMVSSYTQLLERRYKDKLDNDANDFINYAVNGAKRMQQLINDLLMYSRVGTRGKSFEITDCNEVLKTALENLEIAIRENNATVTYDPLPVIEADAGQLVQLFQNLIENAIKFHRDEPPHIHISAEKQDREWVISVRDNGIGIEEQYFERVFSVFQRLHRDDYLGTGIGLSIVQKIVQRHGGRIWIESEVGKGTAFRFTLPVSESRQTSYTGPQLTKRENAG
jgi:signal transduction histidine kinase